MVESEGWSTGIGEALGNSHRPSLAFRLATVHNVAHFGFGRSIDIEGPVRVK